jgi:hypothetical protein
MEILEQLNTIIDTQRTRYFRFQKVVFLSEIKTILEKEGIETHLLTDVYRNQKYHSLLIGNINNAKKVVITHYDTSSLIHDLFKFEAFETKKRQKISLMIDGFKSIIISSFACVLLFILIQNILNGNNIVIYSILSLILFLISVYLIRLPIFLPSILNENKNTLKYLFKKVVENNPNISYVIVDDGLCYQMGYQILSKYLKQVNKKYEIELLDQVNETLSVRPIEDNETGDTRMKYFDGLKAKTYTS